MKREDYQAIVDLTSEVLNIRPREVRLKKVYAGRANPRYITLPIWIEKYDEQYQIYYAVHEICHYLPNARRHNLPFKLAENKALELWGITIIRRKEYPKELFYEGWRIENIPR